MLMQDEVLRGFARMATVSDGATLAVEAPTAARRPSTRDTVAMDGSPAMGVTASALEGTSRLQRLLSPNGGVESRYEDLGFLGQGGMGEVRRVRDHDLGRTLAMKIIGEPFKDLASAQTKFIEEARICAGLQHPGIVPLYELGQLPDGRFYFTMQEIEGHNFGVHIAQYHAPARAQSGSASGDSPGLRRLMDTFHRVCEAVAYAHARGIVHRDLKPKSRRPSQTAPQPTDRPHSRKSGRFERVAVFRLAPPCPCMPQILAKRWQQVGPPEDRRGPAHRMRSI